MTAPAVDVLDGAGLELRGVVDITQAEALHAALLNLAASGGDVLVGCGSLGRLDTAAMQLLLAFRAELKAQNRILRFGQLTPTLRALLDLAGLSNALLQEEPGDTTRSQI